VIVETRVASPTRLEHRAAFYSTLPNLLHLVLSEVQAAADRREPVALIVEPDAEREVRARFGAAPGLMILPPPEAATRGSGQTVATHLARELRELAGVTGRVSFVMQHEPRLDGNDGAYWTELDAAVNVALCDLPITMTCLFPAFAMQPETEKAVHWNHPQLIESGLPLTNPDHLPPEEVIASVAAPPLPPLGPAQQRLVFTPWELHAVRAAVADVARRVSLDERRAEDLVLAVNEIATNAVEYGTGDAEVLLWASLDGLICEVHNSGRLTHALPGLQPPHPGDPRGRGIWIARQLCDLLHIWSDGDGTHVRIHAIC
jgi:anti-sigma regulatory factor (Ser/Thr protein kinase)